MCRPSRCARLARGRSKGPDVAHRVPNSEDDKQATPLPKGRISHNGESAARTEADADEQGSYGRPRGQHSKTSFSKNEIRLKIRADFISLKKAVLLLQPRGLS